MIQIDFFFMCFWPLNQGFALKVSFSFVHTLLALKEAWRAIIVTTCSST